LSLPVIPNIKERGCPLAGKKKKTKRKLGEEHTQYILLQRTRVLYRKEKQMSSVFFKNTKINLFLNYFAKSENKA